MSINNSQKAIFPEEMKETMTGSPVTIGVLEYNPVVMFFDNLGNVQVEITVVDSLGSKVWKTFAAQESLSIDCRANHGIASNFTPDIGTTFIGNGASGDFSISYVAAKEY